MNIFNIGQGGVGDVLSIEQLLLIFFHALVLGLVLTCVTYFTAVSKDNDIDPTKVKRKKEIHLLGATNILFLCVGLTAIMILVNNNIARAFAIGAAISLCRFRVRLNEKSNDSNLLFGIIVGMACGLANIQMAYLLTFIYAVLQMIIIFVFQRLARKNP